MNIDPKRITSGLSEPSDPSLEQKLPDNQSLESTGFDLQDQLETQNISNSVSDSVLAGQEVDDVAHSMKATDITQNAKAAAAEAAKAAQDAAWGKVWQMVGSVLAPVIEEVVEVVAAVESGSAGTAPPALSSEVLAATASSVSAAAAVELAVSTVIEHLPPIQQPLNVDFQVTESQYSYLSMPEVPRSMNEIEAQPISEDLAGIDQLGQSEQQQPTLQQKNGQQVPIKKK